MQGGEASAAVAVQQEDANAWVKAAMREALLYLGVNHSQHGLVNVVVATTAACTGSSAYPRMMLPESPHTSCTQPIPDFHAYPQGNRFSGEWSLEVRIVALSMPAPVTIDLNATLLAGESSSGGMRKRQRKMPADMLTSARNLFDGMSAAVDDDTANRFLENMIFEGDEVGLDSFPLNHELPEDYDLEKEDDDMDIVGEPLFEEELANQTIVGAKLKRKRKRTKAYTLVEDKLFLSVGGTLGNTRRVIQQECNKFCATYESIKARPMSDLGMQDMVFQALEAFKVQHDDKAFHLAHCWNIINGEEKFKAQYAALLGRGGKQAMEDHGGEKDRPRWKTNSKNLDKRDATSIALLEKVEGMISKKDLMKEKGRQEKEEQMHTFMEIQRRRFEMDAERQAKMLD
ncbi:Lectin-domain containing receptor kinase A4.3 [Hordeum vulgare]|nr:Lectin-domain containing receptor kinase A4.3 [Hordeum vulgare]